MLKNKENFKDNEEVYKMLVELENAHRSQDLFKASILLTRLEQKNIKIIIDSKSE
jgi:hypothetical protein